MIRRFSVIAICLALLVTAVAPILSTGVASADAASDINSATFTFTGRAHITGSFDSSGQLIFTDNDAYDSNFSYPVNLAGSKTFCDSSSTIQLWSSPDFNADSIHGNLTLGYRYGGTCKHKTRKIMISNPNHVAEPLFLWNNSNITTVNGQSNGMNLSYAQGTSTPTIYLSKDGSDCGYDSAIALDSAGGNSGTLYIFSSNWSDYNDSSMYNVSHIPGGDHLTGTPLAGALNSSCGILATKHVDIGGTPGTDSSGSKVSGGGSTTGAGPSLSCDAGLNPLNWLICGVVSGLVSIVGDLDNLINGLLSVGSSNNSATPSQIFCSSATCNSYHAAWASFRDLALGLIVLVGLIIIVAQAMGTELVDAYTLKKTLPRVLIAALAITLSWPLMQFFIEFTNSLGYGIRYLIYAPFSHLPNVGLHLGGGGGVAVDLVGAGAITAMGIFGLLSFAATAALAVFVAFIILILRQLIIVLLLILAPIALVAYVLPNTQNAYKLWWDSFSKALLMFPIIAAFIAAGRVFSAVTLSGDNGGNAIYELIGFAAYFAPYFLIPLTVRFAGGALRGIGGFVNDSHRGAFAGLKKYRQTQTSRNLQGMQNFTRFKGKTPVGRAGNVALGALANPRSMLRGRRGVIASQSARQTSAGGEWLKNSSIFQSNSGDDAFLLAIANEGLAKQKIADARTRSLDMSATALERSEAQQELYSRERALDNARQMGNMRFNRGVRSNALMELAKTGYQFDKNEKGYEQLADTARQISGGDERAYTGLMDQAQYHLKNGGRYDLAGLNHGAGYDAKTGTDKASLYELANAKPQSIRAMTYGLDAKPLDQDHIVAHKELSAMLPNSKGAARDAILDEMNKLEAMGVKSNTAYLGAIDTSSTTERRFTRFDPSNAAHAATWSAQEQAAGYRYEMRQATNEESAERRARTYERPDPNRL